MSQRQSKKVPYFTSIAEKICEKLCSLQSTVSSLKVPQTPEEHFALFLLKYVRQTSKPEYLEKKFNIDYDSGVLRKYIDSCDEVDIDLTRLRDQLLDAIALKIINPKHSGKICGIIRRLMNEDVKIRVSEEEYKELLFLIYCYNFASWSQLETLTDENLLIYIRTLKLALKGALCLKQIREEVVAKFKNKILDEQYFRNYSFNYNCLRGNLEYLYHVSHAFFRIEDICLDYPEWKHMIMSIDNFDAEMRYSLYVRIHQDRYFYSSSDTGTAFDLVGNLVHNGTEYKQVAVMIHYWYYGFFEGYYAKLLFNILHSASSSFEKQILMRLLVVEEDKEVLKYFKKEYKLYCKENSIPESEQVVLLKSLSQANEPDEKGEVISLVKQLPKPDNLSDEQIKCLTGKLVELGFINVDSRDHLSFLLGGKGPSSRDGLIHWKKSRASLAYFIKQLYGRDNKIASGTWQIVASNFAVVSKGEYKQFPESKSYANLHVESIFKKDENKDIMKQIDDCISEVRNYIIKKN